MRAALTLIERAPSRACPCAPAASCHASSRLRGARVCSPPLRPNDSTRTDEGHNTAGGPNAGATSSAGDAPSEVAQSGGASANGGSQSGGAAHSDDAPSGGLSQHGGFENAGAASNGGDGSSAGADSGGTSAGGTSAGGTSASGASGASGASNYTDVTPRLTPATSPAHVPPLAGSIELHGEYQVDAALEPTDPLFVRVLMKPASLDCVYAPDGFKYNVDVYAVTLTSQGPQHLIADTCAGQLDSIIQVYQDASGSASPFDLDDACPHLVGMNDDGCGTLFGQSRISLSGLKPGVVLIAVTSFGTHSTTPAPYTLRLSSDTSVP